MLDDARIIHGNKGEVVDARLVKAMVIGDGYLTLEKHYRNVRFGILHTVKQREYLLWKQRLLRESGLPTHYSERADPGSPLVKPTEGRCEIRSGALPELTSLRELMYPKARGFLPGVLDDLEVEHLAIIFMDDGGKNASSVKSMKRWKDRVYVYNYDPYIISFTFCLQSSGVTGCEQFKDWIESKFQIESKVTLTGNHQPVVKVYKTSAKERLRDLLLPYLHQTMRYKVEGRMQAAQRPERLSGRAPVDGWAMRQSGLTGTETVRGGAEEPCPPASELVI
jgi:hypothetical protein